MLKSRKSNVDIVAYINKLLDLNGLQLKELSFVERFLGSYFGSPTKFGFHHLVLPKIEKTGYIIFYFCTPVLLHRGFCFRLSGKLGFLPSNLFKLEQKKLQNFLLPYSPTGNKLYFSPSKPQTETKKNKNI